MYLSKLIDILWGLDDDVLNTELEENQIIKAKDLDENKDIEIHKEGNKIIIEFIQS